LSTPDTRVLNLTLKLSFIIFTIRRNLNILKLWVQKLINKYLLLEIYLVCYFTTIRVKTSNNNMKGVLKKLKLDDDAI